MCDIDVSKTEVSNSHVPVGVGGWGGVGGAAAMSTSVFDAQY